MFSEGMLLTALFTDGTIIRCGDTLVCAPQLSLHIRRIPHRHANTHTRKDGRIHLKQFIMRHPRSWASILNTDATPPPRAYHQPPRTFPFSEPLMICLPSSLKLAVICRVSLEKPLYLAFIPKSSVLYSRNRESFVVTNSCSGM